SVAGGLGGAVAEWLSEVRPTPLKRIGTMTFGESGDPRGLYAKFGFDPDGIARSVSKFLGR
ncbi:MAG TPA: transketolase family protein, partial [Methylomirabilota bacterium]